MTNDIRRTRASRCPALTSRAALYGHADARVYALQYHTVSLGGWHAGVVGWIRTNPLGHTASGASDTVTLFNMCNRQRAQILSIESINDSIVRSRRDTRPLS